MGLARGGSIPLDRTNPLQIVQLNCCGMATPAASCRGQFIPNPPAFRSHDGLDVSFAPKSGRQSVQIEMSAKWPGADIAFLILINSDLSPASYIENLIVMHSNSAGCAGALADEYVGEE